ncbi:hypothetical protein F5X68DRAFT_275646 [Plectosphaerella plurivora]|uniref:Uncharacterized protein n=1 Tax=Plectosphaerella plurivora TaxID=936078 RepID=A0A9P9A900_9PEZI|nr:hypothetical protein F5X68DRAFT_275646 [Plectosphaerella plurivora]
MDQASASSQGEHQAGNDGRVIGKWADLKKDETRMLDDLIPTNSGRSAIWSRVFKDGWDSSKLVPQVGLEAPKRQFSEGLLHVGTLIDDALLKGAMTLHPSRRKGQPVFMRLALGGNVTLPNVRIRYVDECGVVVPGDMMELDQGVAFPKVYEQAMNQHDKDEVDRVNDWNLSVVVMWARHRLRVHLGLVAPRNEDETKLEQLVSPMVEFKAWKALILSIDTSSIKRPDSFEGFGN